MRKLVLFGLLFALVLTACGGQYEATGPQVTVYRSPT